MDGEGYFFCFDLPHVCDAFQVKVKLRALELELLDKIPGDESTVGSGIQKGINDEVWTV